MKFFQSLLVIGSLITLLNCGGTKKPSTDSPTTDPNPTSGEVTELGAFKYTVVEGTKLQRTVDSLSGSGKLLSKDVLDKNNNFAAKFTLADGGWVTFYLHANQQLESGAEVTFRRVGKQLRVDVLAPGAGPSDPLLPTWDASVEQDLNFDLHTRGETHFVLEGGNGEELEKELEGVTLSELKWGIELHNATVTFLERSAPKHEHGHHH